MIPLQRPSLGETELAAVAEVLASGWMGMGPKGEAFESRLRELLGGPHVLACATGTAALHLALAAIEAGPGAEVIVPSQTFVATVAAVEMAGLRPVFCDVEESGMGMDVDDALGRITPRTCALLPVHYGGSVSADFERLLDEARRRGVRVVEDAAHAFGSTSRGRRVGSYGDITCFSFDPIKNITCGEGGAVVTRDAAVAERVAHLRNLGIDNAAWRRQGGTSNRPFAVTGPGWRYHLPDTNAAIGLAQLDRLEAFRARKLEICDRYDAAFGGMEELRPLRREAGTFPFLYVVCVLRGRRDELRVHLKEQGVGSGVHYVPNHLQPHFARYSVKLPVTERLFDQIVTLPLFCQMSDEQTQCVIGAVQSFFAGGDKGRGRTQGAASCAGAGL